MLSSTAGFLTRRDGLMDEDDSENAGVSVAIFDSRLTVLAWFLLCVGLLLCSTLIWGWGVVGAVLFGTNAVFGGARLLGRPVRLQITDDGLLDQNFWPYAGFIPWDEILEFRPRRWGLIEIRLRDADSFLERHSPFFQLSRTKVLVRGLSPVVLWTPFLSGSKADLLVQLESGLDRFTLAGIRRDRMLERGRAGTT